MVLLYAREKNSLTKEYEVINQDDAKARGWKQYDVEFEMNTLKWYLAGYVPAAPEPTKEEQQKARQEAYIAEVDPITCHIQRLSDEEQTPEVISEITSLVEERKAKVEEIKQRYPYPVEPIEEIEELPVAEEVVVSKMENTTKEID